METGRESGEKACAPRHEGCECWEIATKVARHALSMEHPKLGDLVGDFVQEAFLAGLAARKAGTLIPYPAEWLKTVTFNKATDYLRSPDWKNRREMPHDLCERPESEEAAAAAAAIVEPLDSQEVARRVRSSVVTELAPRQCSVIMGTYWQGKTSPEIAEDLGIDERTVRSHRAAGEARLGDLMRGDPLILSAFGDP